MNITRNPRVLFSFSVPVQIAETLYPSDGVDGGINKLQEELKVRITQRILQNDSMKLWNPYPEVTQQLAVLEQQHIVL